MKAITFQAPHELAWESVPEPELRAEKDALVRVRWTAICGSDLHVYRGHETGLDRGTIMGHEFVGEVLATGSAVERFTPGDAVVCPFTTSCGQCFYCERGLTSRCTEGELFGWVEGGHGLHGAQAEIVRVPLADTSLVAIPAGVPLDEALFAGDVFSTGYFCADQAGIDESSVVAVVGCGPVGLSAVIAARSIGAREVFAFDSVPERLELARGFGATPCDIGREDARAPLDAATDGRGADAALELVGSPGATRAAIDLLRPGGTISAAGVHNEVGFAFSPGEAYDKNLTYRAGRCPARAYMERSLALIAAQKIELGPIISHRLPMEAGVEAYVTFDQKKDRCTKVFLEPGSDL